MIELIHGDCLEENKSPVASKALPHENVVIRCWNPDCRKVATCRDGSGWEWCDDHVDQEKTGSVLHTAQEYYDVDFYTERVRVRLTETDQQARERCAKIISELQYQNALIKEGNSPVIKNARNGGYILNEHQRRMDMEFDKALQAISNPPSQA